MPITMPVQIRDRVWIITPPSLLGSAGQVNYAAANGWMDGWAADARGVGAAASSVQWGAWGGTGMAAGKPGVLARTLRLGIGKTVQVDSPISSTPC